VLQAFPGSFSPRRHAVTVGNPVREEIAALPSPELRFAGRDGAPHLLVLGGSQGALALNRAVPAALAQLPRSLRPIVRHQTGVRTASAAIEAYRQCDIDAELPEFIEDMASAYAWADLVICRSGALTVAEICAAGLPAIFVPFPAAVDDHQTANARPLAAAGAADILQERDLTAVSLAKLLSVLLADRDALRLRAQKARQLAKPDSLSRITTYCLQIARARS
jgi:UDP-N-acetylglucosamine--N-acetylmuramyl-(pentapeptide) pyrophosphoryl-undecaprenol N-acetylglucosamine transferase